MQPLIIGDLKVKLPIVQGGMGVRVSGSGLAAAVANAGCIGVISSAGSGCFEHMDSMAASERESLEGLRSEILKAKRLYFGSLFMEGYSYIVWRPID